MRVGIKKEDVATWVDQFMEQGLKGIGLVRAGHKRSGQAQ